MKRISEFIKELESLKEKHGDLPVVTLSDDNITTIPDNDSIVEYWERGAFDDGNMVPAIVISW